MARPAGSTRFGTSPRRHAAALLAGLAALALPVVVASRDAAADDAYITYGFARAIAQGEGFVWAGEPSLGTTSPLLATLLGGLERLLPLGIPSWGHAVTWISVALLAAGLLDAGAREGWWRSALATVALLLPAPFVARNVGFEWFPALAALVLSTRLAARGRYAGAGVALAVGAAFRSEAALAALPFAAVVGLGIPEPRLRVRRLLVCGLAAAAAGGLWLLVLHQWAGTVVPLTLAAKRAQVATGLPYWQGGPGPAAREFWSLLVRTGPVPAQAALVALLALGALVLAGSSPRRRPTALFVALLGPLVAVALALLRVPIYPWYAIPLALSATLLVATAGEAADRLTGERARRIGSGLFAAAVALLAVGLALARWREPPPANREAYRAMAAATDRFPSGTRVGALEIGFLGWHSRQPVVDLLGLVSPGARPEEIAALRLRELRERLGIELLVFWLQGGALFEATFGPAAEFYERFELEEVHRASAVPMALYRRRTLARRGDIELDLTAVLARSGRSLVSLHRRSLGGYAVVLEPGERLAFDTGGTPGPRRFEAAVFGLRREARLGLERAGAEAGTVGSIGLENGQWRWWDAELTEPAGRLALKCEGPGRCALLAPIVRRTAAAGAGR